MRKNVFWPICALGYILDLLESDLVALFLSSPGPSA